MEKPEASQRGSPNIGTPRDTMAAQDCEDGLRLYLMNQPGWPRGGGCRDGCRPVVYWPTLRSYQLMRQIEDNNGTTNGADQSQRTET